MTSAIFGVICLICRSSLACMFIMDLVQSIPVLWLHRMARYTWLSSWSPACCRIGGTFAWIRCSLPVATWLDCGVPGYKILYRAGNQWQQRGTNRWQHNTGMNMAFGSSRPLFRWVWDGWTRLMRGSNVIADMLPGRGCSHGGCLNVSRRRHNGRSACFQRQWLRRWCAGVGCLDLSRRAGLRRKHR